MENFLDFYSLYKSTNDISTTFSKDSYGKTCKFCKKSYPDTLFKNIPHVIPELFGKNNIVSNSECDVCNSYFQKYENDTSLMIHHFLSLLNIKTKKGVPTFQSYKKPYEYSTKLEVKNDIRFFDFKTNLTDFEHNESEKTLTIYFNTKRFCPYSVYKVFLKIGISLLSNEDLEKNKHYLKFLMSDTPIENGMQVWTVFRYLLKTKYYKKPIAYLYKAKNVLISNQEFPEYILLLCFANVVFQFFLPISISNIDNHNEKASLRLELYPSFLLEELARIDKKVELHQINLNETRKVSISDKIILSYDESFK